MCKKIENFFIVTWQFCIYIILKILFIDCNLKNVKVQKYDKTFNEPEGFSNTDKQDISDNVLNEAINQYTEIAERDRDIDDKAKFLFGITTFLITATLGSRQFLTLNKTGNYSLTFTLFFSALNFILILQVFSIKKYMKPKFSFDKERVQSKYKNYDLLKDYLKSSTYNEGVLEFKTDLIKGTYRLIKMILVLIGIYLFGGIQGNSNFVKQSELNNLKANLENRIDHELKLQNEKYNLILLENSHTNEKIDNLKNDLSKLKSLPIQKKKR